MIIIRQTTNKLSCLSGAQKWLRSSRTANLTIWYLIYTIKYIYPDYLMFIVPFVPSSVSVVLLKKERELYPISLEFYGVLPPGTGQRYQLLITNGECLMPQLWS